VYPDLDKEFGVLFAKERESVLCDRIDERNSPAGHCSKEKGEDGFNDL